MKKRATSKKDLEQANSTLFALLRSPKSKAGLRAAVAGQGLSIHFITGWLSQQMKEGTVIPVQQVQGADLMYVLGGAPALPEATPTKYPAWLEPRALPQFKERRLVSMLEGTAEQQLEDEGEIHEEKPAGRRPQRRAERRTPRW